MSTIDLLSYDFDEERGFGAPARAEAKARTPLQWAVAGAIAVGVIVFVLAALRIITPGGWGAFLGSFGVLIIATPLWYWLDFRGTQPGIKHDDNVFSATKGRGWIGIGLGVLFTAFYVVLYWYGDLQRLGLQPVLDGAIELCNPLALAVSGTDANQWLLYGWLYTCCVFVFGVRMFMKYRHNRYQIIRTSSVIFFQLGFAFMLPNFLKMWHQPEFYFTYFWPLKPSYLWPTGHGDVGWLWDFGPVGRAMVLWGIIAILVATPALTYFYGKRWYCSWVCGCGGLAETLGDPWRHLGSKKRWAWRLERWLLHGVLVVIILGTALLWVNSARGGAVLGDASSAFSKWYGFFIVNVFAGVVGVGFYPLLGSRVWCRFGCPMAAILGLLQRYFSRFRITTNGAQCMSCGNCSTYCEMGIDVRAYAQRGANIVRASCVGCGVCAAVCPRGVLKLENGKRTGRYEDQGGPLDQMLRDLRLGPDAHGRAGGCPQCGATITAADARVCGECGTPM